MRLSVGFWEGLQPKNYISSKHRIYTIHGAYYLFFFWSGGFISTGDLNKSSVK